MGSDWVRVGFGVGSQGGVGGWMGWFWRGQELKQMGSPDGSTDRLVGMYQEVDASLGERVYLNLGREVGKKGVPANFGWADR